jgi:hypothetical protein
MGPRDVAEFEAYVVAQGGRFLPWCRPTETLAAVSSTTEISDRRGGFYLVRACDLSVVRLHHVPTQGYWLVDAESSPLVEYWPYIPPGAQVTESRLWFTKDYLAQGSFVQKNPDFVRWADGLLRFMRKRFRYDPEEMLYVGPDAGRLLGGPAQ